MFKKFIPLIAALTLSACTAESLVQAAYPDRVKFSFLNSAKDEVYHYYCVDKGSDAATTANAQKAHRTFDKNLERIADRFVVRVFDQGVSSQQATAELDASAEALGERLDAEYGCFFVDSNEVK